MRMYLCRCPRLCTYVHLHFHVHMHAGVNGCGVGGDDDDVPQAMKESLSGSLEGLNERYGYSADRRITCTGDVSPAAGRCPCLTALPSMP